MGAVYLHSGSRPKFPPVLTAQAVGAGDATGIDATSKSVVRAQDVPYDTTGANAAAKLANTQTAFASIFVGMSGQLKEAGKDRPGGNSVANEMRIACGGVWRFACVPGTYNHGDWVGMAANVGLTALLNDTVVGVADAAKAIGKVHKAVDSSASYIEIEILSTVSPSAK